MIVADLEMHLLQSLLLDGFLLQRGARSRLAAFILRAYVTSHPRVDLVFHVKYSPPFCPLPSLSTSYLSCVLLLFLSTSLLTLSFLFPPLISSFFFLLPVGLQGEVLCDAAERDRSPEVLPGQRGTCTSSVLLSPTVSCDRLEDVSKTMCKRRTSLEILVSR